MLPSSVWETEETRSSVEIQVEIEAMQESKEIPRKKRKMSGKWEGTRSVCLSYMGMKVFGGDSIKVLERLMIIERKSEFVTYK